MMKDRYVVVNNLKSGTKISESSRFYINDILAILVMIFIAILLNNFIYDKLIVFFVIFNAFVAIYMTAESKSNPKFKRIKALNILMVRDTTLYRPLKNISQIKKTHKILESMKNEEK